MSKAKHIEIVNQLQLLGFLTTNGTGCRFVGITYRAEQEERKQMKVGQPFGKIFKVSKFQGMVNVDYVEAVRSRIAATLEVAKENVEYVAGKSSYVHPFPSAPCVVQKASGGEGYYLQYFPTGGKSESVFVDEAGTIIDAELVKPWLRAKGKPTAWKPGVVSLKLENIVEMRASGLILSTEDADEAKDALLALRDSKVEVALNDTAPALVPA